MPESALRRIRASAGSGKTYELTSRFLALLASSRETDDAGSACAARGDASKCAWPAILAVTFTNRAAAEMRERILGRLKAIALGVRKKYAASDAPLTPALAGRWLDVILRHYGSLNVCTIDSLLCRIARMASLDLGLPPDFEPGFNPEECLEPLWTDLVEEADALPELGKMLRAACLDLLLHTRDFRGFLAGDTLRKKTLELVMLFSNGDDFALSPPKALAARRRANAVLVRESAAHVSRLLEAGKLGGTRFFMNALAACTALEDDDPAPKSTLLSKDSLDECLLKASRGQACVEAEKAYFDLRDAVDGMRLEYGLLSAGLRLAPFANMARVLTEALSSLLRREGRVPQALIARFASRALNGEFGVSEALCRMGVNLSHVLIDEFQDTSREQWEALRPLAVESLARGGSVTYVGDVKQAIYGWRGGDADLFDEAANDLALRAIVPSVQEDTLPTNHRSRGAIVRHNNQVFSRLAAPETAASVLSVLMPGAPGHILERERERLCQAFSGAGQLESGKPGGLVRIDRIEGNVQAELEGNVREALVERLREITSRRPCGDVAVLTRSNPQSFAVAGWLLEEGFPVVTENSFLLASHPLVVELVALLTFLNTPDDDPAFWTLATGTYLGPGGGLSLEALQDWLCSRTSREVPLWQLFQKAFPEIWSGWLAPFWREAGLVGLYDVVSEALHRFGIHRRFPGDETFAERFLEVLHLAENQGYGGVSAFLEYWSAHGGEEKAPMPQGLHSIRVMTMHKAKGLQFPVVVAPWLSLAGKAGSAPRPVHLSGGISLLSPPTPAMGDEYYELLGASVREELHLLYVTWTRPEDELHVFITGTPKNSASAEALEMLLNGVPETRGEPLFRDLPEEDEAAPPVFFPPEEETKPRPLSWLPELKIFRAPQNEFGDTAKRRGTLAHKCLELLRLTGDAQKDAHRAVARGMDVFPAPIAEPLRTADEMEGLVAWFAALPDARRWISFGTPEQTLVDADGQLYRADLVVNDGTRVSVVDYKTGERHPAHRAQLERYMRLVREAQPLPVDGALVYLDLREVERAC